MNSPVIFLDIDGVLTNPGCYAIASGSRTPADSLCVAALNYLTDRTAARIVISSTWRIHGLMFCREKLNGWGVKADVIDCTPRLPGERRGAEIARWLAEHEDDRYFPDTFVILDDDMDLDPFRCYLVQTEGSVGLTMADAERAIQLLKSANAAKSQPQIDSRGERQEHEDAV